MKIATRTLAMALAASLAAIVPSAAHSHDGWRHHHHGRTHVGIGLGFGFGYYDPWYYPGYYPGYVVVQPVPVVLAAPPEPVPPLAPAPVIAPLHGQSAQQTEFDVQQCNRWAMTQPAAMADAHEFHRTAMGCVQARGYAIK